MNSKDLNKFIHTHGIQAEIVHFAETTLTVPEAATQLGVDANQIIKTILFLANGEPVLAIGAGEARLAWKRLADHLGVSRRRLKTASAEQVRTVTGYVIGSVPPFGHRRPLRTVVDTAVYKPPFVYGGGGDINALIRIETDELRRILGSETAGIRER